MESGPQVNGPLVMDGYGRAVMCEHRQAAHCGYMQVACCGHRPVSDEASGPLVMGSHRQAAMGIGDGWPHPLVMGDWVNAHWQ